MSATTPRAGLGLWWEAARPRTLPAALAPVMVATALAWHDGVFQADAALTCLAFALLIQIGTNYANDYYDFVKGADTRERVGPRRAVAAGLIAPATMKRAMIGVFALSFVVGLTLLQFGGWPLLVVGVLSIACGIAYTGGPYPLAYHGWGDVFVFIFFGLVAVTATYFVQAGGIGPAAWLLGTGIGALATNILVVNNYRDIETDRRAGKLTTAVRFGPTFAQLQFAAGHAVMVTTIVALGGLGVLTGWKTLVLAVAGIGVGVRQLQTLRSSHEPKVLIALLGATGRYVALMALLLSLALVL